jgi:hypothetical protein
VSAVPHFDWAIATDGLLGAVLDRVKEFGRYLRENPA